jgi:GAF domain-containing protein
LTESLPKILQSVCEQLNWRVGEFWVRDQKDDVLRLAAFSHLPSLSVPAFEAASRQRSFQRGVGLPGRTWVSARLEWIEDVTRDANFSRAAAAAQSNLHSGVAFPILIRGEVYGVMEFFNSLLKPDEELLNALGDISLQISRYIELHCTFRQ